MTALEAYPSETEALTPADAEWPLRYASLLVVIDCVAIFGALVVAYLLRFHIQSSGTLKGVSYALMPAILGPVWLFFLVFHRCYEQRVVGAGSTELRLVLLAGLRMFGYLAIVCYVGKIQLARGFVAIAFPIGVILLLAGRYAARQRLYARRRATGAWTHRVLALGDVDHVEDLVTVLHRDPNSAFRVVAACVVGGAGGEHVAGVPVVGGLTNVLPAARASRVDTIAVTASRGISSGTLRQLSWDLEGTGIGMVVAPALTDIAGPRISVRPVAGLPLLHVDEPDLGHVRRIIKRAMDLAIAGVMVIVLSPLFAVLGLLVRLTTPGPAVFRQTRIGAGGREFCLYKFRSMHDGAQDRLAGLRDRNEAEGAIFKIRDDPRVTPLGRWLRKFSLDELPQLVNVVKGDMSLVGPRPHLPNEASEYDQVVLRRLKVEPGITGLWQVSGRSDLSWEDAVRLDLYYVENWSPLLDLTILLRTVLAVIRSAGAY